MRECTLFVGQTIVIDGDVRLTVLAFEGDEIRFGLTRGVAVGTVSAPSEAPPVGHFAGMSEN
jgi:sRNA-binding carbon storage regulator CsrA